MVKERSQLQCPAEAPRDMGPGLRRDYAAQVIPYFANLYAPPFSIERWKAGRACMRDSHALKFGYGPSLSNTLAMSTTKLIWISAPVSVSPTKNCLPFSARST